MTEKTIRFGLIGLRLMAREFASATLRWAHLTTMDVRPGWWRSPDEGRQPALVH